MGDSEEVRGLVKVLTQKVQSSRAELGAQAAPHVGSRLRNGSRASDAGTSSTGSTCTSCWGLWELLLILSAVSQVWYFLQGFLLAREADLANMYVDFLIYADVMVIRIIYGLAMLGVGLCLCKMGGKKADVDWRTLHRMFLVDFVSKVVG